MKKMSIGILKSKLKMSSYDDFLWHRKCKLKSVSLIVSFWTIVFLSLMKGLLVIEPHIQNWMGHSFANSDQNLVVSYMNFRFCGYYPILLSNKMHSIIFINFIFMEYAQSSYQFIWINHNICHICHVFSNSMAKTFLFFAYQLLPYICKFCVFVGNEEIWSNKHTLLLQREGLFTTLSRHPDQITAVVRKWLFSVPCVVYLNDCSHLIKC